MREFGPPSVLRGENVPSPTPGPGQVVIDVAFANVTFVETQVRAGEPPNPAMLPKLPVVPGNGVGGVLADGRRVVASLNGSGGYAELAAADASALIDIPDGLETDQAIALLADGRTALALLRAASVRAGETVLVEAAAGGVGHLLVQLAGQAGARVIGAAGGERKLSVVRELGAELAVDYSEPGWADRLRTSVGTVDVVFDGVGGQLAREAFSVLHDAGRFVPFGMASGSFGPIASGSFAPVSERVIRLPRATPEELRELAQTAIAEATAGRLHALIGQRYPLEQAAAAHTAIEQRATIGKTLLVV